MAEACYKIFSEFGMEGKPWAEFDNQINLQSSDVHMESAQHTFQESRAADAGLNKTNLTDNIIGMEIPTDDFSLSEWIKAWQQSSSEPSQPVSDSRVESRCKTVKNHEHIPAYVSAQHEDNIPAHVSEELRSPGPQPVPHFGVEANSSIESENLGNFYFPQPKNPMWDSELPPDLAAPAAPLDSCFNNTTEVASAASSTVPDFHSDIYGVSLPLFTPHLGLSPLDLSGNPSCSTAIAPNQTHMAYPNEMADRPRLETEGSAVFGEKLAQASLESEQLCHSCVRKELLVRIAEYHSNVVTGSDTSRTAPTTSYKDAFEMEKIHICKRMMGTRLDIGEAAAGLEEELASLISSYKRCRDKRRPTHIKLECASMADTTAFECCWSEEFESSNFPDEKKIMESFQRKCTRAVNTAILSKQKNVNLYPDFVNTQCEEWFKLQKKARESGKLRGTEREEAVDALAERLGLTRKQVERKWDNYRVVMEETKRQSKRHDGNKESKKPRPTQQVSVISEPDQRRAGAIESFARLIEQDLEMLSTWFQG